MEFAVYREIHFDSTSSIAEIKIKRFTWHMFHVGVHFTAGTALSSIDKVEKHFCCCLMWHRCRAFAWAAQLKYRIQVFRIVIRRRIRWRGEEKNGFSKSPVFCLICFETNSVHFVLSRSPRERTTKRNREWNKQNNFRCSLTEGRAVFLVDAKF